MIRSLKRGFNFVFAFIVFGLMLSPAITLAVPIVPPTVVSRIFVQATGTVDVTFLGANFLPGPPGFPAGGGSSISFNTVGLSTTPPSLHFFDSTTAPLLTFTLGSFTAGDELEFILTRVSDGVSFFSGATLSPGGVIAASLDDTTTLGSTIVFFEDFVGVPADEDFDDMVFLVSNTATTVAVGGSGGSGGSGLPVPEPATFLMMSVGFGALVLKRKKK